MVREKRLNHPRRTPSVINQYKTFTLYIPIINLGKEVKYRFVEVSREMHDLTGFQRDLLYVIAGADQPSGQSVKDEVEKYYNSEINHGRLYPNLDTLVNKELVEKGQLDRRTNYYAITDAGEQQIQERREWENQYVEL